MKFCIYHNCKVCYYPHARFRSDWLVERAGKWRELDYTAPVYPTFACGAGNVLSADLVRWLALNADHLKLYQVLVKSTNHERYYVTMEYWQASQIMFRLLIIMQGFFSLPRVYEYDLISAHTRGHVAGT